MLCQKSIEIWPLSDIGKDFFMKSKYKVGWFYIGFSNGLHKVGVTTDIMKRNFQYTTENPFGFSLLYYTRVYPLYKCEKKVLESIPHEPAKRKEWFALSDSDIKNIKSIVRKFMVNY